MLSSINDLEQQNSVMQNLLQANPANNNTVVREAPQIISYHVMPDLSTSIDCYDGMED